MNEFFMKHKIEMVVCRNCDFPMEYEGENPRRYHLFRCKACGNRVGIQVQGHEETKKKVGSNRE